MSDMRKVEVSEEDARYRPQMFEREGKREEDLLEIKYYIG